MSNDKATQKERFPRLTNPDPALFEEFEALWKKEHPNENFTMTENMRVFAEEYPFDWNSTRAAKASGYAENIANRQASENMTKPVIKAYMAFLSRNLERKLNISREKIAKEYAKLALSNVGDIHKGWLELADYNGLTRDQLACIQSIKHVKKKIFNTEAQKEEFVSVVEIKLHDKKGALDSFAKLMQYNAPEELNVNVTDSLEAESDESLTTKAERIRNLQTIRKTRKG